MISVPRSVLAFVVLFVSVGSHPGAAQQRDSMAGMKMSETKSAAPYHPGLGELMTAFVQPRHIKLGFAGNERNWAYAAYELGELTETFDDVAKLVPKHDNLPIPEMIASTVKQPMAALGARSRLGTPQPLPRPTSNSPPPATRAIKARAIR